MLFRGLFHADWTVDPISRGAATFLPELEVFIAKSVGVKYNVIRCNVPMGELNCIDDYIARGLGKIPCAGNILLG